MELTNLNYLTFCIFILILSLVGYFSYIFYKNNINFNKSYKLLASGKYFYIKYLFLILSFILIFVNIFGVKYGLKQTKNETKGIDIMFVLDVSKSMNVGDIIDNSNVYTRLEIMKKSITNYVVKHTQDRFGLVIFAGDAVSTIPLTTDHDIFLTFLENVDYRNLTVQGSNFEKAISLGVDRFTNSEENRSKVMVFISDGGDEEDIVNSSSIIDISKKVKAVNYFIVGVGTKDGGKIITGKDPFGRVSYGQYNGNYVISKINQNNLEKIKNALNGEYLEISKAYDLITLDKYINNLEKKVLVTDVNGEKANLGRFLSIISFLFFMVFLGMYVSQYPNLSLK